MELEIISVLFFCVCSCMFVCVHVCAIACVCVCDGGQKRAFGAGPQVPSTFFGDSLSLASTLLHRVG